MEPTAGLSSVEGRSTLPAKEAQCCKEPSATLGTLHLQVMSTSRAVVAEGARVWPNLADLHRGIHVSVLYMTPKPTKTQQTRKSVF